MVYHQDVFLEASSCSEDLYSASGAVTPWFVPNLWHIKIGKLVLVCSRVFVLDSGKHFLRITYKYKEMYTGCTRRNVPGFGRVFLMLKYTDITQNTYAQI